MKGRFSSRMIDVMVLLAIASLVVWKAASRPAAEEKPVNGFAQEIDLSPFYRTAAYADGRLRSFESHAKSFMGFVLGPRSIDGQSNAFTYLDLMFRPDAYRDRDIIYVKNKLVLEQILHALEGHPELDEARKIRIQKSKLVAPSLLATSPVINELQDIGRDLIRGARDVNSIQSALNVADTRVLSNNLCLIPPPSGRVDEPWFSMERVAGPVGVPQDAAHAGITAASPIPGMNPAIQAELAASWNALQASWVAQDAQAANAEIAKLAELAPTVSPSLYPSTGRLAMESWYFKSRSMTWVWLLYLVAVIPLLMSVVYRWRGARVAGQALFLLAFAFHTASLIIRWYISGRFPNSNMFEAITTAAWFGGVMAIALEWVARKSQLRDLFSLGSAVMSMVALMAGYFLPADLDSTIRNKMAALNDVWLYIHTNMIIWSYAVIGLACIPALLLLRHRWCLLWDGRKVPRLNLLLLPIAIGVFNYTCYALLMHGIAYERFGLAPGTLMAVLGAFAGSGLVVALGLLDAKARIAAGDRVERSAGGGAVMLMGAGGGGATDEDRPSRTQVYDGATMILVELSFIMLWVGVVMGAIWADHSWGRPWGWDPKEVFALNTFIIFLILIHVRLKVKDRAFWTAVLAVLGFEVMMFNWIVVNFVISGLHSYA